MANWHDFHITINDPDKSGKTARWFLEERYTHGDGHITIGDHTIQVFDEFKNGEFYELMGRSRNDSIVYIVEYVRKHFPKATITGSVLVETRI